MDDWDELTALRQRLAALEWLMALCAMGERARPGDAPEYREIAGAWADAADIVRAQIAIIEDRLLG